jgi:hypothetical protein
MSIISRRRFLAQAALATGAAALATHQATAAGSAPKIKTGADLVTLGNTGIKSSLLGMGTGSNGVRRSSRQLRLGQTEFARIIRHGIDRGLRYIDTADQYGTHIFVREAIKGVDREKLFIQTKTRALRPEVAKVDLDRFRQELGTDYIDCLLMHCMTTAGWPADMRPVMDVLFEAKEKKILRSAGISCHGFEALGSSVTSDWLDVQLVRINPFGRVMDEAPEKVVPRARAMHEQGKGVIGMKIFACDQNMPAEQRLESLKFVLGLGCVDCFTIGFESTDQIDDTMDMIERVLA